MMKILVIGKGTEPPWHHGTGVELHFKETPNQGTVLDPTDYDFAFWHLADHATSGKANLLDDWKTAGNLSKLIAFGGGGRPGLADRLLELKVPFFPHLPTPDFVKNLPWHRVPTSFTGNAGELVTLLQESPETIRNMVPLCKGFLITHLRHSDNGLLRAVSRGRGQTDWKAASEKIQEAARVMNWLSLLEATGPERRADLDARLESRREETDKLEWWMEPLGDWLRAKTGGPGQAFDETALKKEVEQRFGALPCKDTLALLKACHESTAPSVETVALAYLELAEMLGERPKSVRGPL